MTARSRRDSYHHNFLFEANQDLNHCTKLLAILDKFVVIVAYTHMTGLISLRDYHVQCLFNGLLLCKATAGCKFEVNALINLLIASCDPC